MENTEATLSSVARDYSRWDVKFTPANRGFIQTCKLIFPKQVRKTRLHTGLKSMSDQQEAIKVNFSDASNCREKQNDPKL